MIGTGLQIPLRLRLGDGRSFGNFVASSNEHAVTALQQLAAESGERVFLWGPSGTGKTHLLQACCRAVAAADRRAVYLPMREAGAFDVRALADLECVQLVCIDDIDTLAGDDAWERALFEFLIRTDGAATALVFTSLAPVTVAGFRLLDLSSRLSASTTFRLHPLPDDQRCAALQVRARERGFEIPDDVARFVLTRCSRDMHSLFRLLEELDRSTLSAKRRVTVPFVKALLESRADFGGSVK